MYGRVFLKEVSIWNSRLSKQDGTVQRGWASSNLLRVHIKQQGRGRAHWLFIWVGTSIFPCLRHWHSWFSVFWSQTGTHTIRPWFSGLWTQAKLHHCFAQLADGRSWNLLASITLRANNKSPYYKKSLCLIFYMVLFLYFFGKPDLYKWGTHDINFTRDVTTLVTWSRWCLPDFPWVKLLFSPLCALSLEASP